MNLKNNFNMITTFILIHIIEILLVTCFLFYRKAQKIEQAYTIQNQNVNTILTNISQIISEGSEKILELDVKGTFSSDDEVGFFFEELKNIQTQLHQYT